MHAVTDKAPSWVACTTTQAYVLLSAWLAVGEPVTNTKAFYRMHVLQ